MIITLSGLSGSGKSTAARLLSQRTGIPTVDVGVIFRAMAARHGMDMAEFNRYAKTHPEIDRELDQAMLKKARRGKPLIWQGRMAGWMAALGDIPSIKCWIKASATMRAGRIARREGISQAKALRDITRRDRSDRQRYLKLYGLDVTDLSIYDAVIPTDNRSPEQVVAALLGSILHLWPKNRTQPLPPKLRKLLRRPQPRPKPRQSSPKRSRTST